MANNSSPTTGRIYKTDGTTVNVVDLLGGGGVLPIDNLATFDITNFTPLNGLVIGEDGKAYDLVTLLEAAGLPEEAVAQVVAAAIAQAQEIIDDVTEVNGGDFVWVE